MPGPYLATALRKQLAKTVEQARVVATKGVTDAIRRLGVADAKPPAHLNEEARRLRNALRAHGRALGDRRDPSGQAVEKLVEAAAYEHWHRMLFARFLAERKLLIHPEHKVPVTIEDCKELAAEEGLPDAWSVAERYATRMLPAIFRPDDPVLALHLAPEHTQALQRLVTELDPAAFAASDSLGWTYQFWRETEKKKVNASGRKIGGDELPAVTQLFTEPYMVQFLLHNTLGAWWAGKVLAVNPDLARSAPNEAALRMACTLPGVDWSYLRFVREGGIWRPAAGNFPGWPTRVAEITVMDPCCGSGHFLTEAFAVLAALRMDEEGLASREAAVAVLHDNLFGLEIDGRCVQIAAFAVALAAWRLADRACPLPVPHIAWVGQPLAIGKNEFTALANGDARLAWGLERLWDVFAQAHTLGSLMDPRALAGTLDAAGFDELASSLDDVFARLKIAEPDRAEGAVAARGMADAAALLSRTYTLQATNVPFLGASEQSELLADHSARHYEWAKTDLSTTMLARAFRLASAGGAVASVTKQEWLFLASHRAFRQRILADVRITAIANLGEEAWHAYGMRGPLATLSVFESFPPDANSRYISLDVTSVPKINDKLLSLISDKIELISQLRQTKNPGLLISSRNVSYDVVLSKYAISAQGLVTRDTARYVRNFWEFWSVVDPWTWFLSSPDAPTGFTGRSLVLNWALGQGALHYEGLAHNFPAPRILNRRGIAISQVRTFRSTRYQGEIFNDGCVPIVAVQPEYEPAINAYVESPKFAEAVRKVTKAVRVTNDYFLKVPFDLDHWQKVAAQRYPDGLPEPYSDDSTQWLFHGHPTKAEAGTPLHVALARLAGYRWPAEGDREMRLSDEARAWIAKAAELPEPDADGILCMSAVAGERPLADRLRAWLVAAIPDWSAETERRLVAEADARFEKLLLKDSSLEAWLRDRFFVQHCALFHQRPFFWQVWDGLKEGFSAILHYHRLSRATLEKLTYTYLNDWIARMRTADRSVYAEKARELQQRLELILEGEKPYDLFVRWKPLERQPLGWEPDLNDGVRTNIRPFVTAGILRATPKMTWGKDRGRDVASAPWFSVFKGDRINDHHTTLDQKRAARAALKKAS